MPARSQSRGRRRAVASLELVMASPLIVAMLVLLFVLGESVVRMNQTVISARTKAWSQRDGGASAGVLQFTPSSTRGTLATGTDRQSVASPTALGSFPDVSAEHTVMVGAWDHRDVDLNRPLSWQAYGKIGGSGLAGSGSDVTELFAGGMQSLLSGLSSQWSGDLALMEQRREADRQQAKDANGKIKQQAETDIAKEKAEEEQLRQRISKLEDDIKRGETAINTRIEMAEKQDEARESANKLERLQIQLEKSDSPFLKISLESQVSKEKEKLAAIDKELPDIVIAQAEAKVTLEAAKEEHAARLNALRESEIQAGTLDNWDKYLE